MPHLIVIYGGPLTGKTALARAVAGQLDAKTAIVGVDALLGEAIRVHDRDVFAELEMVYTQARLLVANYLKNRYHVVIEGSFAHEIEGALHLREPGIDQTLALMRNLASAPLLVRLTATLETVRNRAAASASPRDLAGVSRIEAAYHARYGSRSLVLSTDGRSAGDLASEVLAALLPERY